MLYTLRLSIPHYEPGEYETGNMKIVITEKGLDLLLEIEPVIKLRMEQLFADVKVDYEKFNDMLDAMRG